MKANYIVIVVLLLLNYIRALGQDFVPPQTQDIKKMQITAPETSTEYSITSYKNIDFLKINPIQLDAAGMHTEVYISNTNRGVIIISSAEANKVLMDLSHRLELNPAYYETFTRQETIISISGNNKIPFFDFTKASSINHNYKNAFNYTIDPRTGVSWSNGNYDDINVKGGKGYGQLLYDIILWLPKGIK